MADKARLGILISGRGSNMVAIADSIDAGRIPNAKIVIVISNKDNAKGIESAMHRGLPTSVIRTKGKSRDAQESEILINLKAFDVTLVCLAGFMRILSPWFVEQFPNRILNIHPSLLPAFPGEHAHRDVLNYGAKVSGCTVHIVDEQVDHGPIIVQRTVPVLNDDNEDSLAARVLKEEHIAYTEAINMVLSENFKLAPRHLTKG